MGEKRKKSRSVSPGGGIPSQWRWPRDLLLFGLVTAFCQDSVHNSGAHQQPRTVQRPGWSAWTKSKQITFPAVTDLQLTDRTACQRMTSKEHKDMSHPHLFLLISERVKSLSGRYFSWSRDIRPMSQGLFSPQIGIERQFIHDNWAEITCKWGHIGNISRQKCLLQMRPGCLISCCISLRAHHGWGLSLPLRWCQPLVQLIQGTVEERFPAGLLLLKGPLLPCHCGTGAGLSCWSFECLVKGSSESAGELRSHLQLHSCDCGILLGTELKVSRLTWDSVKFVLACC